MANLATCILDYGSGNVKSVYNVLTYLGYDTVISNDSETIRNASHCVESDQFGSFDLNK